MKRLLVFYLVAACHALQAQDSTLENTREQKGRQIWFAATSIPADIDNPVSVLTSKGLTQLKLSKRRASDPVGIGKDSLIRLVQQTPNPNDPTKPAYHVQAAASIPENMHQALVLLVPKQGKKNEWGFNTKVQDLAGFKGGDYMFINLTNTKIVIQLSGKKVALNPASMRVHKAPKLIKPTNAAISYHYLNQHTNEWKLLSSSTVVLSPTRREICVFSTDPKMNRINYRGITFPVQE